MSEVKPLRDESIEALIKRFSKAVTTAGTIQEVRAREAFEKPSDKVRKDKIAAKGRIRKYKKKMDAQIEFDSTNKFRPEKKYPRPNNSSKSNNSNPRTPPRDQKPKVAEAPKPNPISSESLKELQDKFKK